jgi:hypothetical protein
MIEFQTWDRQKDSSQLVTYLSRVIDLNSGQLNAVSYVVLWKSWCLFRRVLAFAVRIFVDLDDHKHLITHNID